VLQLLLCLALMPHVDNVHRTASDMQANMMTLWSMELDKDEVAASWKGF
jgi:hypothetical protein